MHYIRQSSFMGDGTRQWDTVLALVSRLRLATIIRRIRLTTFSAFSLSHISPRLNVPVRAILAAAVFNLLFGVLYLGKPPRPMAQVCSVLTISTGPTVAFNAYIASCTIFLNCSYAAPILILLIRGRRMVSCRSRDFSLGHTTGLLFNYVSVVFVGVTSVVRRKTVSGPLKRVLLADTTRSLLVLLLPSCTSCRRVKLQFVPCQTKNPQRKRD